jgi:hypothetical protein
MPPPPRELREQVHVWSFLCSFGLLVAMVTVLGLLQGAGVVTFNSDRAVLNGVELLVLIVLLTVVGTMGLVQFFLIGIPHMII